jgi:hypothetical protein
MASPDSTAPIREATALKHLVLRDESAAVFRFVMFGSFKKSSWAGWNAARGKAAL